MARRPSALLLASALLLTLLGALAPAEPVVDGDSCLFLSLPREMAEEGGVRWLAPTWWPEGRRRPFLEHPPGAFWPAALLARTGLGPQAAGRLANGLALLGLLAATALLARRSGGGSGGAAALLLLLHLPLWKYLGRAGLEYPFAAWAVLALAGLAGPGRARGPALAFGLAILTRGVFALALLPVLLLPGLAPPGDRRKGLRILAGGMLVAAAFDLLHGAATGRSFWAGYLGQQILPSLDPAATPHPNRGSTLLYYGGRLLLYGAPWWIPGALAWARLRDPAARHRVLAPALAGVLLLFLGSALARREGSRYLFLAWPLLAWAWAGAWVRLRPAWGRSGPEPVLALAALALAVAPRLPAEEPWRSAARELQAEEAALRGARILGRFGPRDDRLRQFLRLHAAPRAFAPRDRPPGPRDLLLLEPGEAPPAAPGRLLALPQERRLWIPGTAPRKAAGG